MKSFFLYLIIISIAVCGCKKELSVKKNTFVTLCSGTFNYTTRNIFELPDHSIIVCGQAADKNNFHRVEICKLNVEGEEVWHKSYLNLIYNLWKAVPTKSGGFVLAGFDSIYWPQMLWLASLDGNGNIMTTDSILMNNQTIVYEKLDMIAMNEGNTAIITSTEGVGGSNGYFDMPTLYIFDDFLHIVSLKKFSNSSYEPNPFSTYRLAEALSGNLYLSYSKDSSFTGTNHLSIMKIKKGTYMYLKQKIYTSDTLRFPEGLVIDDQENIHIATCSNLYRYLQPNISTIYMSDLPNEFLSYGPVVTVLTNDSLFQQSRWNSYSGFKQNASITQMIHTSDGGFLMVGNCNQTDNLDLNSQNEILLIKTDANNNQQWMKTINTQYFAWGADVKETSDGGFLIGAFEKSIEGNYKMLVIKTDKYGNY